MKKANHTAQNLLAVRELLKSKKLDALIVPRSDEFLGESVPAAAERLRWATGFTGSWGLAIIARKSGALVVDGRYSIQAAKETNGLAFDILSPDNSSLSKFLGSLGSNARIGFDPWVVSVNETKRLISIAAKLGKTLVPTDGNLVDEAWSDRGEPPSAPIYTHPLKYAGQSSWEKLDEIAKALRNEGCDYVILSDPHSVAWALNIRGSDIAHTPVALLRAIVSSKAKCTLYIEPVRCPTDVAVSLGNGVDIRPPSKFQSDLQKLGERQKKVMLDPNLCPEAIRALLANSGAAIIESQDPCVLPRARKNTSEQKGARNAQLRDGAALANFLAWLDVASSQGKLGERECQEKLAGFRRATGLLHDLSFGTISAAGLNAALPHYHVTTKSGRTLGNNEIYLIDSGGQYLDGTTDVTRTVIIGKASAKMKKHFTLVLKGMIAVSTACFPTGTNGAQIDTLARAALWQNGLDFDHGTGHGVGSFLSVHEGPARISKAGTVALEPGMILSNEPGFYLRGRYGIRIENLLLVKPAAKQKGGDRKMLSFETLTFAPIDKRMIDKNLLNESETHWLNSYHADVFSRLELLVTAETRDWLHRACLPLKKLA